MSALREHLDCALREYTGEAWHETLLAAKEKYFELTGAANEEDEDYENKMSCFDDWYLFQFIPRLGEQAAIKKYLTGHCVEEELKDSLLAFNYSLFEHSGASFKGCVVLRDIINRKKITLTPNHPKISLVKDDLFIGRTVEYRGEGHLMNGRCILPKECKSILKKEISKVKKLKDPEGLVRFLLRAELLNTKWHRYGHIDATKIFTF